MDRTGFTEKVQALNEQLRRDAVSHLFWSDYMGCVNPLDKETNNNDKFKPSGMPIEVNERGFTEGIGDRMLIPMQLHLAGPATYGDATLIGNEEDAARKWAYVHFNQIRHAATVQKGRMDRLREDALKAAEHAQPDLSIWHSQMENWNITLALIEGVDEGMSTSPTDETYGEGLGLSKRYSPNLFVWIGATAAAASLVRVGDTGKFPTAAQVYAAAANVDPADGTTPLTAVAQGLDSRCVRAVRNTVYRMGLKPLFTIGGKSFWGWVISPEQADGLFSDATYLAMINSQQYKEVADHPLAKGSIGVYHNFVFFEDPVSVRSFCGTSTDGSDLNVLGTEEHRYDDQDKFNPRFNPCTGGIEVSNKTNYISFIFGASMLGKGDHTTPEFEFEKIDYNNWKGVAAAAVYGYERMDFVRQSQIGLLESSPGSCEGVYNRSHLQVITWQ